MARVANVRKNLTAFMITLVTCATFVGCGSSSNLNQVWGKEDNGGDSLLVEGQAAFDAGTYDRAESIVRKLTERNPDNEDAAILLGYIHLAKGGLEPISLSRKLIALSPTTNGSGSSGASLVEAASSTSAASDAATILTSMSTLVNVSAADKAMLYAHEFGKEDADNNKVALTLFTGSNALVVPPLVDDTLRAKIAVLSALNLAIKDVCRFVDSEVKIKEDSRDVAADCTATTVPRKSAAKAHFLWVLSHLSEALVFQPVILYTAPGSKTPSLTSISTDINDPKKTVVTTVAEFTAFAAKVLEVKNAVNKVFNTTDSGSMVQATLQDLNSVILGFGRLAGIPASVQDSITKSFASISSLGKELGTVNAATNTAGFKAQMIQEMSKSIGAQIQSASDKAAASGIDKTVSKAQITAMCDSFDKLNQGAPPSLIAAAKPKACG